VARRAIYRQNGGRWLCAINHWWNFGGGIRVWISGEIAISKSNCRKSLPTEEAVLINSVVDTSVANDPSVNEATRKPSAVSFGISDSNRGDEGDCGGDHQQLAGHGSSFSPSPSIFDIRRIACMHTRQGDPLKYR
jgi:hypothetical protein